MLLEADQDLGIYSIGVWRRWHNSEDKRRDAGRNEDITAEESILRDELAPCIRNA